MKKITREQRKRLRRTLSAAYRQRENCEFPSDRQWQTHVMRRVRSWRTPDYQSVFLMLFERLLWKFSPVALTLVLLLALVVLQTGFPSGNETARMLVEDPVDFGLYAFYGK
jgi:hypothetical protein